MIKTLTTKLAAVFIFLSLLVAASPFHLHHAQAGGIGGLATESTQLLGYFEEAASVVQNTLTAGATKLTAALTGQLQIKEYVLDPIAWMLAKGIISQITSDLVSWINSGFAGSPAFVTELDRFLLEQLDIAAGDFIDNIDALDFVCDPFALDIQIAVATAYQLQTVHAPPACTFSSALGNVEDFLAGDFSQGGFDGMLEIARNPQNTPYGAFLETQISFNNLLADVREQESAVLDFGNGFLSFETCDANGDCIINTPGAMIEEALTFQLETGQRSLIAADEIDEVFGALLGQLLNTALQSGSGLLGLTQSSYSSPTVRTGGAGILGLPGDPGTNFTTGPGTGLNTAVTGNTAAFNVNPGNIGPTIAAQINTQTDALTAATLVISEANAWLTNNNCGTNSCAQASLNQIDQLVAEANAASAAANTAITTLNTLQVQATAATTQQEYSAVISAYSTAYSTFVQPVQINSLNLGAAQISNLPA